MSSKVSQAVTQYGANKVGVYLVAFDEVASIFIGAQNQPVLSTVKWYGSDGSVLNNKLVRNKEAAMFAVKTGFVNPIYAVDNNSYKFKLVDNKIQEMIGRVPRTYAEVAYDAFWVAALTENATAGTRDINYLKKTFLQIANSYNGNYTGAITYYWKQVIGLQQLMETGTIIGDKAYSVQYIADASKYSNYLPIVQKMVDSLVIKPEERVATEVITCRLSVTHT